MNNEDGSAKSRGVYEHGGVLYPIPDPGPDHEICGKAEAKNDPRLGTARSEIPVGTYLG